MIQYTDRMTNDVKRLINQYIDKGISSLCHRIISKIGVPQLYNRPCIDCKTLMKRLFASPKPFFETQFFPDHFIKSRK